MKLIDREELFIKLVNPNGEVEEYDIAQIRARPKRETSKTVERPAVLSKPNSKSHYNFIQEFLALYVSQIMISHF